MRQVKVQLGDDKQAIAVVIDRREDDAPRARIRDNAPHSHYALDRPDIAVELTAFLALCKAIRNDIPTAAERVLELFGGSGWHTSLIQRNCGPDYHEVWDISQDCIDSIRAAAWPVTLSRCDSLARIRLKHGHPMAVKNRHTWVHADYNILTMKDMRTDEGLRESFKSLFQVASDLVTFTETEMYNREAPLFVNHCETIEDAVGAATGWHHMSSVGWGPGTMHAFTKVPVVNASIKFASYNEPLKVQAIE